MNDAKLWTKDFLITSLINFLLTCVFYLLVVIVAVYAKTEFNASASVAGLATGIFIIATLIGRIFVGSKINSIGYKRTLMIGTFLFAASSLLYFIQINIGFFLFVRFLHGATLGFAGTATGTIVAKIIPANRRGEGIGYYSMSSTLATAIGPFLGILLTQHTGYELVFGVCSLLGIISFITSFFIEVSEPEKMIEKESMKELKLSNYLEPKAIPVSFIMLIAALCYSGVLSFMNLYARELHLLKAASFFFLVYSVAILCSRPFSGRLLDAKGANFVMYPAFLFFAIGMFVLSAAQNSFILLLSGVLIGLGYGNMQSCIQALAVKVTPVHRMGLATSTFFIFLDAGLGFGPYLLGFIVPYTTYGHLYFGLCFVILFNILLYFLLHGRKTKEV